MKSTVLSGNVRTAYYLALPGQKGQTKMESQNCGACFCSSAITPGRNRDCLAETVGKLWQTFST